MTAVKILTWWALAWPAVVMAVTLPNGGFEVGERGANGWTSRSAGAALTNAAFHGSRAAMLSGSGDDSGDWRSSPLPDVRSGGVYGIRVMCRHDGAGGRGSAVIGLGRASRDFTPGAGWQPCHFIFRVADDETAPAARLGHWKTRGALLFDDAEIMKVDAVHRRFGGGIELGEAERVLDGIYRFSPKYGWQGSNLHRPLVVARAGFNSNRWLFSRGSEVIYRFRVGKARQKDGRARVDVGYHQRGSLAVEVSKEGTSWRRIATLDGENKVADVALPTDLYPADEMQLRLRSEGEGPNLQVTACDYEASLCDATGDATGETYFVEIEKADPALNVGLTGTRAGEQRGEISWDFDVTNKGADALELAVAVEPAGTRAEWGDSALAQGASRRLRITRRVAEPGEHTMTCRIREKEGRELFIGRGAARLGILDDPRPGHLLSDANGMTAWWCEAGWKVGRAMAPPPQTADTEPIRISAARGEFEAAQIVIRLPEDGQLHRAIMSPFVGQGGMKAEVDTRIHEVAYVRIDTPTDSSCVAGYYPDPLPPLEMPLGLKAGQNQPLWLTVRVARGARAGEYTGTFHAETSKGNLDLPVRLRIWDFELPVETHLRSAFGLGAHGVASFLGVKDSAVKEALFAKYLENFAEHRISPYSFFDLAPIGLRFEGTGDARRAVLSFDKFDAAAARWIDAAKFNGFRLPIQGMGSGTFHERSKGKLDGFEEGAPEYERLFSDYVGQLAGHLRQRGWLDEAYVYWFDEPDPKDYAFVVDGMRRLKRVAPDLKRMLTEQPEPELMGNVDIWCPLTPEVTPEIVKGRAAAGEELWWYLCTGPKAPHLAIFIDHPGTCMRLWPWQSWQYGVQGILVWATVYWSSPTAYPAPARQDPWSDPMSWVSGYSTPVGTKRPWGNGDGRFLYPPRGRKGEEAVAEGPVNSLRWESLRDGMEDYEYLWMLRKAVERSGAQMDGGRLAQIRRLLEVPGEISVDPTNFTTDPRAILARREEIARAIEALASAGRP